MPEVRRPDAGGIVRIEARDNSTELQVAVLPWVFERQLFGARELMGLPGEAFQSYAEEMKLLIDKLCEPLGSFHLHCLSRLTSSSLGSSTW